LKWLRAVYGCYMGLSPSVSICMSCMCCLAPLQEEKFILFQTHRQQTRPLLQEGACDQKQRVCAGYECVCAGYECVCAGYECVCAGYECVCAGHECVCAGHECVCA